MHILTYFSVEDDACVLLDCNHPDVCYVPAVDCLDATEICEFEKRCDNVNIFLTGNATCSVDNQTNVVCS